MSNAQQEALKQVVEVLLNEPTHWRTVASEFSADEFHEPDLARVARELVEMIESTGGVQIDELIGRLGSPAFGRLVTDLQIRGENLLDESYQEVFGFRTPGRTLLLGGRMTFGR